MHQDKLQLLQFSFSLFLPRFGVFHLLPLFHYPSWPIATNFNLFFALNTSSLISIVIKIKHQKIGTFIQLRRMVSNVLVVVRSPIKSFIYKVDSEEMIESES